MRPLNAKYVGKVRLQFDELPSTNDLARVLANEGTAEEGTAILADRQTAGRGQMGTTWEAAPGQNLTLSIIFYPRWLRADAQAALGMAVALAVYDTLAHWANNQNIAIKWPNDLIINRLKVAGILVENSIMGQYLAYSVVGIGINANQMQFSPSLVQAGSVQQITGQPVPLTNLADDLFNALEYWYNLLHKGAFDTIKEHYMARLLGLDKTQDFLLPGSTTPIQGIIRDVDRDGLLCVEMEGTVRRFGVKEMRQSV
jgi:BirA family transcriptional regulator, biotin operon repressor / biotin---[acetyl-CoA-carboxylase] ligase